MSDGRVGCYPNGNSSISHQLDASDNSGPAVVIPVTKYVRIMGDANLNKHAIQIALVWSAGSVN